MRTKTEKKHKQLAKVEKEAPEQNSRPRTSEAKAKENERAARENGFAYYIWPFELNV